MATEQAWADFELIRNTLDQVFTSAIGVHLKSMLQDRIKTGIKKDILKDNDRKTAMAAIANTHPTYTLAYIEEVVEKLLDLNEHLEDEGFYEEED